MDSDESTVLGLLRLHFADGVTPQTFEREAKLGWSTEVLLNHLQRLGNKVIHFPHSHEDQSDLMYMKQGIR